MARGKEAQKRYNQTRHAKAAAEKAAKRAAQAARAAQRAASKPPVITEAALLAFQLAHFDDDTCPDDWFVDAQVALDYDPAEDEDFWVEEDDGLGWYEDGVKRTLTDEQVEMFRHSEVEQIAREERWAREAEGLNDEDDKHDLHVEDDTGHQAQDRALSSLSDASDMDEELVGLATAKPSAKRKRSPTLPATSRPKAQALPVPSFDSTKRTSSSSSPAPGESKASKAARPALRERKEEVPYEQRHKRKWEEHIANVDPVKGTWLYESKTENRLRRELDDVKAESVELDY